MPEIKKYLIGLGVSLSLGSISLVAFASTQAMSDKKGTILEQTQALEGRVDALLETAAQHIKNKGISGVNDFNRDPLFTDKDLYVFSLSQDGVLLSSGGWSVTLIGENVLDLTDEEQRPFFRKILEKAKSQDQGSVEYFWFNPTDGANEPKVTHFRVVNNIVIASGYFPGYATQEQAKELLDLALSEYRKDPDLAMRKFKNKQSGFRNRDQYVFVLDKSNRSIVWSPSTPALNAKPLDGVSDIQGNAFLAQMLDQASLEQVKKIDYWWFSPISQRVELRRAFYQQVGDVVIAVGTYMLSVDSSN